MVVPRTITQGRLVGHLLKRSEAASSRIGHIRESGVRHRRVPRAATDSAPVTGGAVQVRGAYSIESNGQWRSSHARTASWRTGSSSGRSARTQDLTAACLLSVLPGTWPLGG